MILLRISLKILLETIFKNTTFQLYKQYSWIIRGSSLYELCIFYFAEYTDMGSPYIEPNMHPRISNILPEMDEIGRNSLKSICKKLLFIKRI